MQSLTEPSASIDATNGTLTFGALLISSGATCTQLRTAYPDNKIQDMGNGYFWIYFSDIAVGDKIFYPSVCFNGERLFMVDFWFKCKGEKIVTDWNDWSEEYERNQQKKFKKWLTQQIGAKRQFPWGSIGAYYDPKSSTSGIAVKYVS